MKRHDLGQVVDLTARRDVAGVPPSEHDRIVKAIAELDIEETAISAWRNYLHRRIDWLRLGEPLAPLQARELQQLEVLEIAISEQRRALHQEIDTLRSRIGIPPKRVEPAAAPLHEPLDVA